MIEYIRNFQNTWNIKIAGIKFYLDNSFRIDLFCNAIPLYLNRVVNNLEKLTVLNKIRKNQKKSKKILIKDNNKSEKFWEIVFVKLEFISSTFNLAHIFNSIFLFMIRYNNNQSISSRIIHTNQHPLLTLQIEIFTNFLSYFFTWFKIMPNRQNVVS